MAEEHTRATRRFILIILIRRALGRPYLFMAAVLLIIGALWFIRLALEEFLLLDRLVNVYTDEAQIKMDTFAIKPGVTAVVSGGAGAGRRPGAEGAGAGAARTR